MRWSTPPTAPTDVSRMLSREILREHSLTMLRITDLEEFRRRFDVRVH